MKKDEFKERTHKVLNELADYIEKLEIKANEIADDAKQEYREQLNRLKEIRDSLASKLKEYELLTDDKWGVLRESASDFFSTVSKSWKENYEKVADSFRKEDSGTS